MWRRSGILSRRPRLFFEFLGYKEYSAPKEGSGGHTGWPHHPQAWPRVGARLGQVWAPREPSDLFLPAPWVFWFKNTFYSFVSYFPESRVSTHNEDTKAILMKTVLVRVSFIQKHTR